MREMHFEGTSPEYSVTLPCNPDQFSSFISGLLGKPQTIGRTFRGPYELNRRDVEDVFYLVEQRVSSQNIASLVQFIVKIVYEDGSSIQLNSLTAFQSYNEVRPLGSSAIHLSWVYLIQFNNKQAPEKQQIDLSFVVEDSDTVTIDSDFVQNVVVGRRLRAGTIQLRISHTDRTWGADLESLLSGKLGHLLVKQPGFHCFVELHSGSIGFSTFALVFLVLMSGLYITSKSIVGSFLLAASKLNTSPPTIESLSQQISYLVNLMSSGTTIGYGVAIVLFVIISLVGSIAAGVHISDLAGQKRPSILVLTRKDEEARAELKKRINRDFIWFLLAAPYSVALGVVGNYVFYLISRYLML